MGEPPSEIWETPPPPPVNRQTPVKTLPAPILRVRR